MHLRVCIVYAHVCEYPREDPEHCRPAAQGSLALQEDLVGFLNGEGGCDPNGSRKIPHQTEPQSLKPSSTTEDSSCLRAGHPNVSTRLPHRLSSSMAQQPGVALSSLLCSVTVFRLQNMKAVTSLT